MGKNDENVNSNNGGGGGDDGKSSKSENEQLKEQIASLTKQTPKQEIKYEVTDSEAGSE